MKALRRLGCGRERLMLARDTFAFGHIAREQNDDGMQSRTGEGANPVIGVV